MPRKKHHKTAILTAFALETLCVTYGLKIKGGTPFFTMLYLISGVCMAFLLLSASPLRLPRASWKGRGPHTRINIYRLTVIALMIMSVITLCGYWFDEIPLDINYADMLPIIKVMDQRFLAGHWHHIYDPIPSIWSGVEPIYLPSMWQPFVMAVALGIDMRWITVAGLLFAFALFLFIYQPDRKSYLSFFTAALSFVLFWWVFADNTAGVITVSEEGVVIAYYVLLVLALVSGNPWMTGLATSLCMLSRYALAGWVPAFLIYMLLNAQWKKAAIFSLTGLLCLLILFIGPVGWHTFMRLLHLPDNYVKFAGIVWQDSPDVFSTGLGFAGWFGPKRIALLHKLLIGLSFSIPLLFIFYAWWKDRRKKGSVSNIPLATLKITLVVFYCFIDVPYLYLFYTSSFVSLILVTLLLRRRRLPARPGAGLESAYGMEGGSSFEEGHLASGWD